MRTGSRRSSFTFISRPSLDDGSILEAPACLPSLTVPSHLCSTAIPALQPIVHDLFVLRGTNKADAGKELETQKEVVVSMLLRLVQYHQVRGGCRAAAGPSPSPRTHREMSGGHCLPGSPVPSGKRRTQGGRWPFPVPQTHREMPGGHCLPGSPVLLYASPGLSGGETRGGGQFGGDPSRRQYSLAGNPQVVKGRPSFPNKDQKSINQQHGSKW